MERLCRNRMIIAGGIIQMLRILQLLVGDTPSLPSFLLNIAHNKRVVITEEPGPLPSSCADSPLSATRSGIFKPHPLGPYHGGVENLDLFGGKDGIWDESDLVNEEFANLNMAIFSFVD